MSPILRDKDFAGGGFIPGGIILRCAESPALTTEPSPLRAEEHRVCVSCTAISSRNVAALLFAVRRSAERPTRPRVRQALRMEGRAVARHHRGGQRDLHHYNAGSIPHAFEVEGAGIEQETDLIQPGSSATLTLTLKPRTYEVYCPVGADSHKKLGMETHLKVVGAQGAAVELRKSRDERVVTKHPGNPGDGWGARHPDPPGPFPVSRQRGSDSPAVSAMTGRPRVAGEEWPYSNNVTRVRDLHLHGLGQGATRDSVDGVAEFVTQEAPAGARAGPRPDQGCPSPSPIRGVILGLYYHATPRAHTARADDQ